MPGYRDETGRWVNYEPGVGAETKVPDSDGQYPPIGQNPLASYISSDFQDYHRRLGGPPPQKIDTEDPNGYGVHRANWAIDQYLNNNDAWKGGFWRGSWDSSNHCNEFVAAAHEYGNPAGRNYPSVLRNNGLTAPMVADLADPGFARSQLAYLPVTSVQPGDIVVWYGNGTHHSAMSVGNGNVIYQHPREGLKLNSIQNVTRAQGGVAPIVRRHRP